MIVPTVNGVAPDGVPFEAHVPLEDHYVGDYPDWITTLIASGGAAKDVPVAPPKPARRAEPPPRALETAATLARDPGLEV